MKKVSLLIGATLLAFLASCSTTMPVAATSNPVGSKMGESTTLFLFGALPLGGSSGIYDAAKNGGISRISTVDIRYTPLFIFANVTTLVSGD